MSTICILFSPITIGLVVLGAPVEGSSGISTMGSLLRWLTGGRSSAPNDSMSFIDVKDCAAHHMAALENVKWTVFLISGKLALE